MRLTSDVAAAVATLDLSRRRLRSFAFLVGGALAVMGLLLALDGRAPTVGSLLAAGGAALAAAGAAAPDRLAPLYRAWMTLALAMGWVTSRVLLATVFFLVLVPIGVLGRLLGKRFLDLSPDPAARSYWIRRDHRQPVDYRKMS